MRVVCTNGNVESEKFNKKCSHSEGGKVGNNLCKLEQHEVFDFFHLSSNYDARKASEKKTNKSEYIRKWEKKLSTINLCRYK